MHYNFFYYYNFFYTVLATLVVFHNFVSMCDCHMLINDLLLLLTFSGPGVAFSRFHSGMTSATSTLVSCTGQYR